MKRDWTFTALALLLISGAVMYSGALAQSPAYLQGAEVQFGLHARSIALSGHDMNGRFMPAYFQMPDIGDDVWFHPFLVYWSAPWFWVLPFSEQSTRLPTVAIGLLNILLAYLVALKLFARRDLALCAAFFMALTPAHFIHSRIAMDYLHPVPFILGWLWLLAEYLASGREGRLLLACFVLGAGIYSYIASVVLMPLYLAATLVVLWLARKLTPALAAKAIAAFFLPVSAAVIWLAFHPAVIGETLGRYSAKSAALNTFWRVQEFLRYDAFQEFVSVLWGYFNPGYLFFSGGSNYMNATRMAGVFLIPFAVFLFAGIHRAWVARATPIGFLLLLGFFTAPLPAAYVGESHAIDRHLATLPFAVLLGTWGFARLRESPHRWARAAALVLVAAMPIQFAGFYADYMGDYRLRSSGAFDYNVRGVAEALLARAQPDANIYVSRSVPSGRSHWQFASAKAGQDTALTRIALFDPTIVDIATFPAGSLVAGNIEDRVLTAAVEHGVLRVVETIPEVSHTRVYAIYERLGLP